MEMREQMAWDNLKISALEYDSILFRKQKKIKGSMICYSFCLKCAVKRMVFFDKYRSYRIRCQCGAEVCRGLILSKNHFKRMVVEQKRTIQANREKYFTENSGTFSRFQARQGAK